MIYGAIEPEFVRSDNLPLSDPQTLDEEASEYVRLSLSENSLKAYKSDLNHFLNWGGAIPATDTMVANYLTAYAKTLSVATLERRLGALSKIHRAKGHISPTRSELVQSVMTGIRRKHGKPQRKAAPLTKDRLIRVLDVCGEDLKGQRDRALLLIGFAGALRRSELVGIKMDDIDFLPEGLIITIPKSKTDQTGKGHRIGIPYAHGDICPVKTLETYIQTAGITQGPIFRALYKSDVTEYGIGHKRVNQIIKTRVKEACMNPNLFSGHSLRSGFVTSAAEAGQEVWKIMRQTRHKSERTIEGYVREGGMFTFNALKGML
jgi:integrase